MARGGITEAQVRQAIQKLEAKGVSPTVTVLRQELGSGSFSTISAALNTWKEEQRQNTRPAVPEVPAEVTVLFHQLWGEAFRCADSFAEADRQRFAQDRLALDRSLGEMSLEIGRLEQVLATSQGEQEELQKSLSPKEEELRLAELERVRADTALQAVSTDLNALRENLARDQEKLSAWIERVTRAETKLEELSRKK